VLHCFLWFVPLLYLWTIYFFYLGGQSVVSCKAFLAALRMYGYFCDFVVLLSENKYDADDEEPVERRVDASGRQGHDS